MVGRVLITACALTVGGGELNATLARSNVQERYPAPAHAFANAPAHASDEHVTVLTMAGDGAWGAATDVSIDRAITHAIAACKLMSRERLGCGAYYTTIRAGWSLGIRCGRESIVVAAGDLLAAEEAAANRERELRQHYVPDLPACVRVVTVDPRGTITAPQAAGGTPRRDAVVPAVKGGASTERAATPANPARDKTAGDFPVWKTITLGTYKDVNMLREHLDSLDCGVAGSAAGARVPRVQTQFIPGTTTPLPCALGETAAEIIGRPAFTLSRERSTVDLVVLSVPELGFDGERVATADIHARARQLGLELCPAEVGPQLRLQYLDQPMGEFLRIAMEPIATYAGKLVDLTVAHGGASLALIGAPANADAIVHPGVRFVFVRPTRVAGQTAR